MTNVHGRLGFVAIGVVYGVFGVSALVAPYIEGRMGPRMSMVLGSLLYLPFVRASVLPSAAFLSQQPP